MWICKINLAVVRLGTRGPCPPPVLFASKRRSITVFLELLLIAVLCQFAVPSCMYCRSKRWRTATKDTSRITLNLLYVLLLCLLVMGTAHRRPKQWRVTLMRKAQLGRRWGDRSSYYWTYRHISTFDGEPSFTTCWDFQELTCDPPDSFTRLHQLEQENHLQKSS